MTRLAILVLVLLLSGCNGLVCPDWQRYDLVNMRCEYAR